MVGRKLYVSARALLDSAATLGATSRNTKTCLLAVPRLKLLLGIFRRQAFKQVEAMISLRRVAYIKCSAAKTMYLPSHQ